MAKTTNRPSGKAAASSTRKMSAEEYRVLAEHAEQQQKEGTKQTRVAKAKRAVGVPQRKWATDKQVATGRKQEHAAHSATKGQRAQQRPTGGQLWQRQRDALIRRRNRLRRKPWYAAAGATGVGLAGQGVVALLSATTSADPRIVAGVAAGLPVAAAAGITVSGERRYQRRLSHAGQHPEQEAPTAPAHRRVAPEVLLGTAGCSGVVYWIATSGMSWLVALAVLVATSIIGTRWWKDNPIGPGVAPLNPPQAAEPEPTPERKSDPVDEYAKAWRVHLQLGALTNRTDGHNTINYDVELPSGLGHGKLVTKVEDIASALGVDAQQVIPKPPTKDANGWRPANRARLSIITHDAVAGQRYWTGPHVTVKPDGTAGVVTHLARFRDGQGEASLTMWNKDGMVPTAILGGTGGGKSAGMNTLAVAALSTGLLNSVYVDFKGNSSGALRSRARIVIIGRDATKDVQRLLKLLTDVRIKNAPRDKIFPSAQRPGWFVALDEITKGIKDDRSFGPELEAVVTTVRSLGIWPVASSQDMHNSAWYNANTRSAFTKQAVVFYMNTSSDDLINGLTYKPSSLPTFDEDEADIGQEEQPVPGFAVHANTYRANIPCRWDWLPSDDDPVDEEPPYRVSAAFDQFVDEPGIAQDEYDALVKELGPPNEDGRWIIGIGGTHSFPTEASTSTPNAATTRPIRQTANFDAPLNQESASTDPDDLTQLQQHVFQLIEGGTCKRSDIVAACPTTSSTTVDRALGVLDVDGHIQRVKHGHYRVVSAPDPV